MNKTSRVDQDHQYYLVRCLGCQLDYLGGHGQEGDPMMDATLMEQDGSLVFVCKMCYHAKAERRLN